MIIKANQQAKTLPILFVDYYCNIDNCFNNEKAKKF